MINITCKGTISSFNQVEIYIFYLIKHGGDLVKMNERLEMEENQACSIRLI